MKLSFNQYQAMLGLARYGCMSSTQLMQSGVASQSTNLTRLLKPLRETKVIQHYALQPFGKGRKDHIYYLTRKGADIVSDFPEAPYPIRYPKQSTPVLTWTRAHRLRCVDFMMLYDDYLLEHPMESRVITDWDYTHDKKTRKPVREARFEIANSLQNRVVIPDLIIVHPHETDPRVFFVEVALTNNLNHIIHGILGHRELLASNIPSDFFRLNENRKPGVLYVFENENILNSTIRKVRSIRLLEALSPCFLFSTFSRIEASLFGTETWLDTNNAFVSIKPSSHNISTIPSSS